MSRGTSSTDLTFAVTLIDDDDPATSGWATREIKQAVDAGAQLDETLTREILRRLPGVSAWQAKLHLTQAVGGLHLSIQDARELAAWLQPLLSDERPFLRAWSLDALAVLAGVDRDLLSAARTALRKAEGDPSASVRARARHTGTRLGL